ncbi:alpha/beta-hydrolase [Xylariaceae sp. FL0662B]|nr:alpha/beta-hydrolase [Xylariaceae sp. FL0662B]
MQLSDHAFVGAAAKIPVDSPTPIISYSPIVLRCPDRPVDLELRVSFPISGKRLPIILLSHGQGRSNYLSSLEGYGPLVNFWAGYGFVVIQPTHLSSRSLSLKPTVAGQEYFWQSRAQDMVIILDQLDAIEAAAPGLEGRLDKDKVAVAGHSFGAWTASMLLGAKNVDPRDGSTVHMPEKRIKAGVILAGTGNGGSDLSSNARESFVPFYGPDFSEMRTPALVVSGDEDVSPHLTVRGADWHADSYTLAPGPKDLFTVKGGKHGLGGVSGWDAAENKDDESPERLAAVQRMTWAYLKSQLNKEDGAWEQACKALDGLPELGILQSKVQ